jgi:hypothetical protein
MRIPNAENAIVDIRKLRDYCLNPAHPEGKHKARLFSTMLGMTAQDADVLRNLLLDAVRTHDAQLGLRDKYGQRYVVEFEVKWHGKSALVRSGWIIEHHSKIPKLTTCFPV